MSKEPVLELELWQALKNPFWEAQRVWSVLWERVSQTLEALPPVAWQRQAPVCGAMATRPVAHLSNGWRVWSLLSRTNRG
jgi:hypothetical protein